MSSSSNLNLEGEVRSSAINDSSPVRYDPGAESSGQKLSQLRALSSDSVPASSMGRGELAPMRQRNLISFLDGNREEQEQHAPMNIDRDDGRNVNQQALVWGTTVNVQDVNERFARFIEEFIDPETSEPKYPSLLEEIIAAEETFLNLDCNNLREFDPQLYQQLVNYPQEMIPNFDMLASHYIQTHFPEEGEVKPIQVRPFNLTAQADMRSLDPCNIDSLISLSGMIVRVGTLIPDMKVAFFQCLRCGFDESVTIERGRIEEPSKCKNCTAKKSFEMIHNRCTFANKQKVRLQESPENIPDGFTPQTVDVFAFDDLVDIVRPGDRVEVTGIFRAAPSRLSGKRSAVRSIYKTFIDAIHFKRTEVNRFDMEADSPLEGPSSGMSNIHSHLEETDVLRSVIEEKHAYLHRLASDPMIYERLAKSLAPGIFGFEDIKKGVLCQLFGGSNKDFSHRGRKSFRGDINILLCGDPGTSKSQLLRYVHQLAPRGIYTSGKGSSAVGLTAYVTKDPESGQMILESGALVLSDQGICCIDEFDKMSDTTRSILHEVMEQQTISIAKAGVIASLNARTSILAAANPVNSRYSPNLSVVENIRLPPPLLSRFDLIYLVLDKPSEAGDRRLAKHLVSLFFDEDDRAQFDADSGIGEIIDIETLSQYISYARKTVTPRLSERAGQALVDGYTSMRKRGQTRNRRVITATPRQLESLIRLSEGLAKMRLSESVEESDVQEAIRLMDVSLGQSATDPETGLVDIDIFTTGLSSSSRRDIELQASALQDLYSRGIVPNYIPLIPLMKIFNENSSVTVNQPNEFRKVVDTLANAGFLRIYRQSSDNPDIRRLSIDDVEADEDLDNDLE